MSRMNAGLALAGTMLVGCGLEVPAPRVAPSPKTEAAVVAVTEEAGTAEYTFNPVGKRDPFEAPRAGERLPIEGNGEPTDLQKFELDALQLKFTSASGADSFATIVDPTGEDHVVRVGEFIGKDWGRVSHISRESIEITTKMMNEAGQVFTTTTALRMPSEASGGRYKMVRL